MSVIIPLVIASIVMVPGIVMAFVPVLPALSYMFIVALIYGVYDKFITLTISEIFILLGVLAVSIIIDQASGVLGAKYGGAHTKSLLWGILGAIVGTFFSPVVGSFLGLFIAVLASELYYKKSHEKALKAAGSALAGKIVGVLVNIGLAIIFMGLFLYFTI